MKLSLRPKCTCNAHETEAPGLHFLSCDLHQAGHPNAKLRKRFFFFYPLKKSARL